MTSIRTNAAATPTNGEITIGITTLSMTPDQWTALNPAFVTTAAPTSPPMSACDEDDGRPKYQVRRFHAMAPMTAANTSARPRLPWGAATMPLPTVPATRVDTAAPIKFRIADMPRATRGVSARVEIDVAIALAAS